MADTQAAFNHGRRQEEIQLGLPANALGNLVMPAQGVWDAKSPDEKALFLLNAERAARAGHPAGVIGLPFQDWQPDVKRIAEAWATYLVTENRFGHFFDDTTDPFQRIASDPVLGPCSEFLARAENIAGFWTQGGLSNPLPVERAIYNWIYEDAPSFGHREAALLQDLELGNPDPFYGFKNNVDGAGSEGFIGIAVIDSSVWDPFHWGGVTMGTIVVMNIIDPQNNGGTCPWELPPTPTPIATATRTPTSTPDSADRHTYPHPDRHPHPNRHGHRHAHPADWDAHPHTDLHPDRDAHTYAYRDRDKHVVAAQRDSHPHTDRDRNRDTNPHANRHGHRHAHPADCDTHPHTDLHPDRDAHTYAYRDRDKHAGAAQRDAHPHADRDRNRDTNPHANRHGHRHAHPHADGDLDRDTDPHAHRNRVQLASAAQRHAHSHADRNRNRDTNPHANRHGHRHAHPTDWDAHSHPDRNRNRDAHAYAHRDRDQLASAAQRHAHPHPDRDRDRNADSANTNTDWDSRAADTHTDCNRDGNAADLRIGHAHPILLAQDWRRQGHRRDEEYALPEFAKRL